MQRAATLSIKHDKVTNTKTPAKSPWRVFLHSVREWAISPLTATKDQASALARKNQVSSTESGFRETLLIPCSISQRARSGWSDGP